MIQENRQKKKPINLVAKELTKWGINGCHVACTNITIKRVFNLSNFYQLKIIFLQRFVSPFVKEDLEEIYLLSVIPIKQVMAIVLTMTKWV